jgi:hypothetical protein
MSPSSSPSWSPTVNTSASPTTSPTTSPTASPTKPPSRSPHTSSPSVSPSNQPTVSPSKQPTSLPTTAPSKHPTNSPSQNPTVQPSHVPSVSPSLSNSPTLSFTEGIYDTLQRDDQIETILLVGWILVVIVLIAFCIRCWCMRRRYRAPTTTGTLLRMPPSTNADTTWDHQLSPRFPIRRVVSRGVAEDEGVGAQSEERVGFIPVDPVKHTTMDHFSKSLKDNTNQEYRAKSLLAKRTALLSGEWKDIDEHKRKVETELLLFEKGGDA